MVIFLQEREDFSSEWYFNFLKGDYVRFVSWFSKTAKSLFIFLFFSLELTTQERAQESVTSQVSCHMIGHMMSMGKQCTDHIVVV